MAIDIQTGGSNLKAAAQGRVKDGSRLLDSDWGQAVDLALARYNKDRPREVVSDIAGTGAYDYATPTGWETDFSELKGIEYPVGLQDAAFLVPQDDFTTYKSPSGEVIRLIRMSLYAGDSMRVTITARHTDETTVRPSDIDALANLVAAEACETLSSDYAKTNDSLIQADVVDHKSRGAEYAARAKQFRKLYEAHIGVDKDTAAAPATATTHLHTDYPDGSDRLVHRRRRY